MASAPRGPSRVYARQGRVDARSSLLPSQGLLWPACEARDGGSLRGSWATHEDKESERRVMPVEPQDYYTILGVPRDADPQTIKRAFRQLAFEYHPDRNKTPAAEERFKAIAEAYAVLSDPDKRTAFDAAAAQGASVHAAEDLFSTIDFRDLFRGLGFDFAEAGPFDHFLRYQRQARAARGADLEATLTITLQRVATGGDEMLPLRRPTVCPTCQGTGAQPGTRAAPCPACHGRGQRLEHWRQGSLRMQQVVPCSRCQGQGLVYTTHCVTCRGQQYLERDEQLTLTIPPGVEEGMVLRVPGHGQPSREPGGLPGDLFVLLRIAPDPRFERRGSDLWQEVTLPVEDAVLGTQVAVPTAYAPVPLTMPAGIQPGTVVCLRQYGLPEFGNERRGDMYVRVQLHLPQDLSPAERAAYEELRALKTGSAPRVAPAPAVPPAGTHSAMASSGFKGWLAQWWERIDTTVRQWLKTT
jgi:molecular chaperone DnaJ